MAQCLHIIFKAVLRATFDWLLQKLLVWSADCHVWFIDRKFGGHADVGDLFIIVRVLFHILVAVVLRLITTLSRVD